MQTSALILLLVAVATSVSDDSVERHVYKTLKSFQSYRNDFIPGSNGIYSFVYHVGDSERAEERNEEGQVNGHFAFVAPEGDEYLFKYGADDGGYRVESDALPTVPEDTDEVKRAKEHFFQAYQEALERAEDDDYSSEESDEDSDESDEDFSDESSEEDDEDSDSDSDEDEEEEEGSQRPLHFGGRLFPSYRYNKK
ncbi:uncharacterized protein [Panulirus ornatus]|uniref:uncharacterized protein n=1 Tax=Panulirus ornatus TaxID=150431 RepID=UPI003A85CC96